jgi:hypothetical protein
MNREPAKVVKVMFAFNSAMPSAFAVIAAAELLLTPAPALLRERCHIRR